MRTRSAAAGTRRRGFARSLPKLCFEGRHLIVRERRRDDGIRALEEVVDDLDLLRTGTEARERVDEPLQAVVGIDDLLRRESPMKFVL